MLVLLAATMLAARGQNTAFRYILGETGHTYTKPDITGYYMGVGLDRTFRSGLTIALDFQFDLIGAARNGYVTSFRTDVLSLGTFEYLVQPRAFGLCYHTEYPLGDPWGAHGYFGTYIGYKRISQEWKAKFKSSNYDPLHGYERSEAQATTTAELIPIGFRLGVRGAVDGGFVDLYGMIGYQIGGGKELFQTGFRGDAPYTKTAGITYGLGCAFGIGW